MVDRRKEAGAKRRDLTKKAHRWVVEVCRSWFNRFRKLLVRHEKLERDFVALDHIAAAIIAFGKVPFATDCCCANSLAKPRVEGLVGKPAFPSGQIDRVLIRAHGFGRSFCSFLPKRG